MKTKRIILIANQHPALRFSAARVRKMINCLDEDGRFSVPAGELSLVLTTDPGIARLHGDYLDDPTPTDVITFPGDEDLDFAGEIIVSVDTARRYASENQTGFAEELALYLAHGFLHLAGWDDRTPEDREKMKEAEKEAMTRIQSAGAVPDFAFSGTLGHD